METVIAVRDLRKTYRLKGKRAPAAAQAVDGITCEVPRGEFFGLPGPNGAGKTTTIGIPTTRVVPTGGAAGAGGGPSTGVVLCTARGPSHNTGCRPSGFV
jgi:ABC-2 type transport system ATP-binding protein